MRLAMKQYLLRKKQFYAKAGVIAHSESGLSACGGKRKEKTAPEPQIPDIKIAGSAQKTKLLRLLIKYNEMCFFAKKHVEQMR